MTNWQSRIVFVLAMTVPLIFGLWLYTTVLAGPSLRGSGTAGPVTNTPTASRASQSTEIVRASATSTSVQPPATLTAPGVTQVTVTIPTNTVPSATGTSVPIARSLGSDSAAATEPQDPVGVVHAFYDRIDRGDLEGAVLLWTLDMRRRYPPDENIRQRFSQTQSIRVEDARLATPPSKHSATVSLSLIEVAGSPAATRRFTGTWRLRQSDSGWLLDEPNLQAV